jgi:hypothetical protein
MADTVLTELKIHEFDSVEQMSQYESEIGENDIVYTPDVSVRLPILTPMWFDHQVNDESWLNADTFSWQPSGKYKQTYEHLANDFETATTGYGWTGDTTGGIYITKGMPRVGDTVVGGGYTVGEVGSDYIAIYKNGVEYEYATRNSALDGTANTSQADTIGDITITYYQAKDGHRICLPDQESNLVALYEATGVAWYYILDTDNKQFKLPRTKWGFTGLRDVVGGYVEAALPNIVGGTPTQSLFNNSRSEAGTVGAITTKLNGQVSLASGGGQQGLYSIEIDASKSNDIYQDGATVQPPATQMYLYFWVGAFDQTATEQTAGLNAEMFNGKADRNLLNTTDNVDIVVESQLPTEANGYTWYRKYKSGWVEQGGIIPVGASSITFPIVMRDSNYGFQVSGYKRSDTNTMTWAYISSNTQTTTGFTIASSSGGSRCWQVSGMSAQ